MLAAFLIIGWDLLCSGAAVLSQTTPDASLGFEASVFDAQDAQSVVSGGARRGSSLFHSFTALNVGEGRSLYFTQPSGVEQIFSRVTGNSASEINGTLGVLGDADLFLLNPNGIRFGSKAQLDLAGSFIGSTATAVRFPEFDFATVPEPVPLLTVTAPIGLGFSGLSDGSLGRAPGIISSQATASGGGLSVGLSQTLALVGGEIDLEATRFSGDSGRIELGAVQEGMVELLPKSSGWALDYGPELSKGDIHISGGGIQISNGSNNPASAVHLVGQMIQLSEAANIFTGATASSVGAEIRLESDHTTLSDGSMLHSFAEEDGMGGSITVNAAEQLRLIGSAAEGTGQNSIIFSQTGLNSTGRGGDVVVNTQRLRLEDGGEIFSRTDILSDSDGGNITISASESLVGINRVPTEVRTTLGTETQGSGHGGQLSITTGQLNLDSSYRLVSLTWIDGAGGDVEVMADSISLSGTNSLFQPFPSGIASIAFGSGKGGTIRLGGQDLTIADSANVTTQVLGDRITIAQFLSLFYNDDSNYSRIADLPIAGTAQGGDIEVQADHILVTGINAAENSQPSNLLSGSTAVGDAGDVKIKTRLLEIQQGGWVGSSSILSLSLLGQPLPNSGQGQGGDLTVDAERIIVAGSDPISGFPSTLATQALGEGDGGDTTINTRELSVRDGALVAAGTSNSGSGGRLTINSLERIQVEGRDFREQPATIGTFALSPLPEVREAFFLPDIPTGDTGQLVLNTPLLVIQDGGAVSVENQGSGNAGGMTVVVDQLRLDQQGLLSATSLSGQGGAMDLRIREVLSLRRGSQITAEALGGHGNGGNLNIEAGTILAIPAENSDIIANAVGGAGGNITLRAGGLFGIELQEQLTDRSDITASSRVGLDGTVNIDLLAVDPVQSLAELPVVLLNPNEQISTACDRTARSKFVTTGRGGLPEDPRQQLQLQRILEDWRLPDAEVIDIALRDQSHAERSPVAHQFWEKPQQIVEAQHIKRDRRGNIQLSSSPGELRSEQFGMNQSAIEAALSCAVRAPIQSEERR